MHRSKQKACCPVNVYSILFYVIMLLSKYSKSSAVVIAAVVVKFVRNEWTKMTITYAIYLLRLVRTCIFRFIRSFHAVILLMGIIGGCIALQLLNCGVFLLGAAVGCAIGFTIYAGVFSQIHWPPSVPKNVLAFGPYISMVRDGCCRDLGHAPLSYNVPQYWAIVTHVFGMLGFVWYFGRHFGTVRPRKDFQIRFFYPWCIFGRIRRQYPPGMWTWTAWLVFR